MPKAAKRKIRPSKEDEDSESRDEDSDEPVDDELAVQIAELNDPVTCLSGKRIQMSSDFSTEQTGDAKDLEKILSKIRNKRGKKNN